MWPRLLSAGEPAATREVQRGAGADPVTAGMGARVRSRDVLLIIHARGRNVSEMSAPGAPLGRCLRPAPECPRAIAPPPGSQRQPRPRERLIQPRLPWNTMW